VRKYLATFNIPGGEPRRGEPVPQLLHFCLAQPAVATSELGPDGHPMKGGFLPPVPLPRRMWAGGQIDFHKDLCVGDEITRRSRIADVTVKEGRTGLLCFVIVEHAIEVDGQARVEDRQDIVYRTPDAVGANKPGPVAESGRHQKTVDASPVLLFRYSALTFNGHRFHYDHPYATQVEGYVGLVVHGPLQAALLLGFATEIHGSAPARFEYRGVSPLTDGGPFFLHGQPENGRLQLWTAKENGPKCMTATAEWA